MRPGRLTIVWVLPVAGLCIALSACGHAAAVRPTPPPPPPTPIPTVAVAFQVAVTAVLPTRTPRPAPRPAPTEAPPLSGPYLLLNPNSGPPVARRVTVEAGRLPGAVPVQLVFSAGGSSVSATVWSGRRGDLKTTFSIPGSSPGAYLLQAQYNGITYASARYRVVSSARMMAHEVAGAGGLEITVSGTKFISGLRLLLVAYPLYSHHRGQELGVVQVGSNGKFRAAFPNRLVAGEYLLRAWSTNSAAAQQGEAYFQVVV